MLNQLKKSQRMWDIAGSIARATPDFLFRKPPEQIIIELTNSCNLRCPVCPTHFAMKRARGYMEFDLFASIIDEFKDSAKKPEIAMCFAGEPLLHQRADEFVAYASAHGHRTFISTNTTLLKKEVSARLVAAGLSAIHVCLEGLTKESHEAYRRGSDFDAVKRNIEDLVAAKAEAKSSTPRTIVQTLLTSFSENQREAMTAWAKEIGVDGITFKSLSMGTYTTDAMRAEFDYLLPKEAALRRKTSGIHKTLCSWPLHNALVFWNGELGLCCVDFDQVVRLGNVKENGGFMKTYTSPAAIAKRKIGMRKLCGICKRCSVGDADFVSRSVSFR